MSLNASSPINYNFPYYNTLDQIYNADWSIQQLARLELLRASIQTLWPNGHPTRLIHVVGTGGKGSTSRFLELGLSTVGKSGALMSPHLFDYRERFSIDGEFVSQADISWAWEQRIKPHCLRLALRNRDHVHNFHEVSTLIALALFEKHEVIWAAFEAGIGGRYDQTRAVDVAAVALTNVGADHANRLGKEQWQRVLDKAGSARPSVPFFTTERNPDNLAIIAAVCHAAGAPLQVVEQAQVQALEQKIARWCGDDMRDDRLIHASYQRWNAALSLAVIQQICPTADERRVVEKMVSARLLGRLWEVEAGVYSDVAHNAEKINALAGELQRRFPEQGLIFVVGLSGERVAQQVFPALTKIAKVLIVTSASFKGQDPGQLHAALARLASDKPVLLVNDPQQALGLAKSMRAPTDLVILTGSTYMIEQALNPDPYLRYLNSSFGWRTEIDTQAHGTVQLTLPKP